MYDVGAVNLSADNYICIVYNQWLEITEFSLMYCVLGFHTDLIFTVLYEAHYVILVKPFYYSVNIQSYISTETYMTYIL